MITVGQGICGLKTFSKVSLASPANKFYVDISQTTKVYAEDQLNNQSI